MNQEKTLYSKRFSNHPERFKEINRPSDFTMYSSMLDENIADNPSYQFIPNDKRQGLKSTFTNHIIKLSERYELDVDICEEPWGCVAALYFPSISFNSGFKSELLTIIAISDETLISEPKDEHHDNYILFTAVFYSHDIYIDGKKFVELD